MDPQIQKYLLTALGGALVGGGATGALAASGGERFGETPEERRSRITRNVLLGSVAGGGGAAALHAAGNLFSTAAPERNIVDRYLQETGLANPFIGVPSGAVAGAGIGAGGVAGARYLDLRRARALDNAGERTSAGKDLLHELKYLFSRPDVYRRRIADLEALKNPLNYQEIARLKKHMAMAQSGGRLRKAMGASVKGGGALGGILGLVLPFLANGSNDFT